MSQADNEPATLQKNIIYADNPGDAIKALRDELRAKGHKNTVILDSLVYYPGSVERATRLIFVNATKRDEIIRDYRSEYYQKTFGHCDFIDVPIGPMGEPTEVPDLGAPASAGATSNAPEPDALDDQLESMGEEDLRTFYRGVVGRRLSKDTDVATIIQRIKDHRKGAVIEDDPANAPADDMDILGGDKG